MTIRAKNIFDAYETFKKMFDWTLWEDVTYRGKDGINNRYYGINLINVSTHYVDVFDNYMVVHCDYGSTTIISWEMQDDSKYVVELTEKQLSIVLNALLEDGCDESTRNIFMQATLQQEG